MTHARLQRRLRGHKVVAQEWLRDQYLRATSGHSPVYVFHHNSRREGANERQGLVRA